MQGKAFTKEQKDTIIQSLQEYLELGFSRNRACKMVGLSPVTLHNWIKADEALGIKIQGWENAINKLVLANLRDSLQAEAESDDARKENSKWWAERKMREDFSTKQEVEQTGELILRFDDAFTSSTEEDSEIVD